MYEARHSAFPLLQLIQKKLKFFRGKIAFSVSYFKLFNQLIK